MNRHSDEHRRISDLEHERPAKIYGRYFRFLATLYLMTDHINATAAMEAIRGYRPAEGGRWEIPVWESQLHAGIYPLCAHVSGQLHPIGTAFCISRLGIVLSALHNVREAFGYSWDGEAMLGRRELPEAFSLKDLGLSVIHSHSPSEGRMQLNVWPLERMNGAPPSDLVFGFPTFQQTFPYLALPMSFAVPRIGATVTCVGYGGMSFPDEDLTIEDPALRMLDRAVRAAPQLKVVEGKVKAIFVKNFANGYVEGPCFAIDAELEHGQSGGPVFDERGYVCGVVAAGASQFFDQPSGLVSLLYPILLTDIDMRAQLGIVTMNLRQNIIGLLATKSIVSDGSETQVVFTPDEGRHRIGPLIPKEDGNHVYDDFGGFQAGAKGTVADSPGFRLKRKESDRENSE